MSTETLRNIRALEYLRLSNCSKIEVLPPQIANQRFLETLDLSDTNLKSLPSSIGELSNLKYLSIKCCKDLAEIGTLPNALI
jgi:Leucine-rich repeat (LRR) protein